MQHFEIKNTWKNQTDIENNNIKLPPKEVGFEAVDCIRLSQNRILCWALVNTIMIALVS